MPSLEDETLLYVVIEWCSMRSGTRNSCFGPKGNKGLAEPSCGKLARL